MGVFEYPLICTTLIFSLFSVVKTAVLGETLSYSVYTFLHCPFYASLIVFGLCWIVNWFGQLYLVRYYRSHRNVVEFRDFGTSRSAVQDFGLHPGGFATRDITSASPVSAGLRAPWSNDA